MAHDDIKNRRPHGARNDDVLVTTTMMVMIRKVAILSDLVVTVMRFNIVTGFGVSRTKYPLRKSACRTTLTYFGFTLVLL